MKFSWVAAAARSFLDDFTLTCGISHVNVKSLQTSFLDCDRNFLVWSNSHSHTKFSHDYVNLQYMVFELIFNSINLFCHSMHQNHTLKMTPNLIKIVSNSCKGNNILIGYFRHNYYLKMLTTWQLLFIICSFWVVITYWYKLGTCEFYGVIIFC